MLKGAFSALITPFREDGAIDWVAFKKLVSWQIEQGIDGLVVIGSTGESPTLSSPEQRDLIALAVEEARGRVPIIAGTGSNDTRVAVERTLEAKKAGADSCLVIFPYYNRPTFEGCLQHFAKIAEVGLPVILYYHPGRTGLKLSAHQLAEISALEGIVGIKDASGDVDYAIEVMHLSSKPLFSGDDSLCLPLIAAGAVGSISVIANLLPEKWTAFIQMLLEGKFEEARSFYRSIAPLCKAMLLENNPQSIKYAMSLDGRALNSLRLPLISIQEASKKQIREVYSAFNLLSK